MRGLRPWGTAVAAASLLVPVLAAPAGAVCTPVVTASAELLRLELPSVPVPLVPPRNASASVKQAGDGSDSASGSTNSLTVPLAQQTFRATNGTGIAKAEAKVASGTGRGKASALVDGLFVQVPPTLLTPQVVVTAKVVEASASVDGGGAPDADVVVAELRVNGLLVPVPVPGDTVVLPAGLGTLVVSDAESGTTGAGQTASATALALQLFTGERLVIASAKAELTGCP